MATYEGLDDKLKIAYPKIIVDVVSILASGVDTSGKKTPVHNVEIYYQIRKSDVISSTPVIPTSTSATTATATSIESIETEPRIQKDSIDKDKDKDEAIEPKLTATLATITGRSKKDIEASLGKLERRDFLRMVDLYKNYSRLQKYSKMVTEGGNIQQFKLELERDIGKNLSTYQVQHAANSVRRVKLYIENVLDGKFVPHGSYGINHTKHNLEYGYLIVGLMQPSRKKT
jgi:hypothetical protein